MATLKDCNCFRESWLLKHIAGKHSPWECSQKANTVTESYILFCLLCYRLSVYTDSAVFNSKLCIILIWFMDC